MIWLLALGLIVAATPAAADPASLIIGLLGTTSPFAIAAIRIGVGLAMTALAQRLSEQKLRATQKGIRSEYTLEGGNLPQTVILGRYATAGALVAPPYSHGSAGKTPNAYRTIIINLADAPVEALDAIWIDGTRFSYPSQFNGTTHADYGVSPSTGDANARRKKYADRLWVKFYDGRQVAADPYLVAKYGSHAKRPWTSDMVGTGVAYAILTLRADSKVYQGEPQVLFELRGLRLYDWRLDSTAGGSGAHRWATPSTWTFTDNPVVMVYNILRGITLPDGKVWGCGVAGADLPTDWWTAAANRCDGLVNGNVRYRAGFEAALATPDDGGVTPLDLIETLMAACDGDVADCGGRWLVKAGGVALATTVLNDGDIFVTSPQEYRPFPASTDRHNAVAVTHVDRDQRWGSREAPLKTDSAAVARDGQTIIANVSLPAVWHRGQAERQASTLLRDAARRRSHGNTMPDRYSHLTPFLGQQWTSTANGYVNKLFEIHGAVAIDPRTLSTTISIRERDPADYDYVVGDELGATPPSDEVIAFSEQPLPGFAASAYIVRDSEGVDRRPGIRLTFEPELDGIERVGYQVRLSSTAEIIKTGTVADVADGEARINGGLTAATLYEVRARGLGRKQSTAWSSWTAVTTSDVRMVDKDMKGGFRQAQADVGLRVIERLPALPTTDMYAGRVVQVTGGKLWRRNDANTAWINEDQVAEDAAAAAAAAIATANAAAASASTALTTATNISNTVIADTAAAIASATAQAHAAAASAANALTTLDLTSRVTAHGVGVLADQYFRSTTYWAWTGAAPSLVPNDHYAIGQTLVFDCTDTTTDRWAWASTDGAGNALWIGPRNAEWYRVEADFTLVSGSLNGAGLRLDWDATDATEHWVNVPFHTLAVGSGTRKTVSVLVQRPSSFGAKTFFRHQLYAFSNYNHFGVGRAVKNIRWHRVSISAVTAEELGLGQVEAAALVRSYTKAESDAAAAGQIAAFGVSLSAPGGAIYNLTADLTQNYASLVTLDQATALLETTLRADYDTRAFVRKGSFANALTPFYLGGEGGSPVYSTTAHTPVSDKRAVRLTIASGQTATRLILDVTPGFRNRIIRLTAWAFNHAGTAKTAQLSGRRGVSFESPATLHDIISATQNLPAGAWTAVSIQITIPDAARPVTFLRADFLGAAGDQVTWADVEFSDVTDDVRVRADVASTYISTANATAAIAGQIATYDASIPGGLSATVTSTQTATADLEGYATATAVLTATTSSGKISGIRATTYDGNGGAVNGALLELLGDVVAPGTLATNRLVVGLQNNLLAGTDFRFGLRNVRRDWQNGTAGAETTISINAAGSAWAGAARPTVMMYQNTGTATGSLDCAFVDVNNSGAQDIRAFSVAPNEWIDFSAQISTHRCTAYLLIVWLTAGGVYISEVAAATGTYVSSSSTNPDEWPRYWVKAQAPATAVYAYCRVRKGATTSGQPDSYVFIYKPMAARTHSAATSPTPYAPDGSTLIDGPMLITGEVISLAAQIRNAIISDAHIANLTANKITVGTGLNAAIPIGATGTTIGTVESRANDPGARLNALVGAAAGTRLSRAALRASFGGNLLKWSEFESARPIAFIGAGTVHSQSTMSIRAPGSWSGSDYSTLQIHQNGTARNGTTDYSDVVLRRQKKNGSWTSRHFPVAPGQWYDWSARVSMHRCDGRFYLFFYDSAGTLLSAPFVALDNNAGASSTNPDEWPLYGSRAQAPANAAYGTLVFRKYGTISGSDSYLIAHEPMVAWIASGDVTELTPFAPATGTIIDGNGMMTDSLLVDSLNTISFSAAGLAIFNDALQSSNYIAGVAGWRLTKAGVLELNQLVVRNSIVFGAVSDIEVILGLGEAALTTTFADIANHTKTIPATKYSMGNVAVGVRAPAGGNNVDLEFSERYRETDGTWSSWTTYLTRTVTSTSYVVIRPGARLAPYGSDRMNLRVQAKIQTASGTNAVNYGLGSNAFNTIFA